MLRFSLLALLVGLLAVGVGCAALASASSLWEQIVCNVTLLLLGVATLGGLYLRTPRRSFCGGFAVSGWLYFLAITLPLTDGDVHTWGTSPQKMKDHLLTTRCLQLLDPVFAKPEPPPEVAERLKIGVNSAGEEIWLQNPAISMPPVQTMEDRSAFYNIGQSLFVLLFGTAGGILARAWQRRAAPD